MGLMDILNGMQNGPGGQKQPTPPGQSSGMSPIMMALLGLLAYKAVKGGGLGNIFGGGGAPSGNAPVPQQLPPGTRTAERGGGLADILGGMFNGPDGKPGGTAMAPASGGGGLGNILGGLFGGAAAGSVLSGGLGNLLSDLQRSGQGQAAQSWVGRGDNVPIQPDDLGRALGADTIDQLSQHTGMPRDDLLQGLSQNLPSFVDQLTPDGRLPTNDEAARW